MIATTARTITPARILPNVFIVELFSTSSFECADQFRRREYMTFHRGLERVGVGLVTGSQRRVQREETKMIVMHSPWRRTRSIVTDVIEAVDSIFPATCNFRSLWHARRQRIRLSGNIVRYPVNKCATWCVGIFNDQCKRFCRLRCVAPSERRGLIVASA